MSQNNQAIINQIHKNKVYKHTIHQWKVKRAVKGRLKLRAVGHLRYKVKVLLRFKVRVKVKAIHKSKKNKQKKWIHQIMIAINNHKL